MVDEVLSECFVEVDGFEADELVFGFDFDPAFSLLDDIGERVVVHVFFVEDVEDVGGVVSLFVFDLDEDPFFLDLDVLDEGVFVFDSLEFVLFVDFDVLEVVLETLGCPMHFLTSTKRNFPFPP